MGNQPGVTIQAIRNKPLSRASRNLSITLPELSDGPVDPRRSGGTSYQTGTPLFPLATVARGVEENNGQPGKVIPLFH